MIEKNELRLQYFITKVEQKIQEEYKVQQSILQLQVIDKLLDLYSHDRQSFEKALDRLGLPQYVEKTLQDNEHKVYIVQHKPLKSKL